MQSWYANAKRRTAYRLVREVKARGVVVLSNWCGCAFEQTHEHLEANGYHSVERRPAYAEPGHYQPR